MRKWSVDILILLALLTLACNFPGFGEPTPMPEAGGTPPAVVTVIVATPTPEMGAGASEPATPSATPTKFAAATHTPTPSVTPTPGEGTPQGTRRPTPTPGAVPPGPPLRFADPAWELVVWHELPDTGDWEGIIRAHVIGGTPPYRYQIEDYPISDSPDLTARWRLCKPMPATLRVWSADGQEAHTSIWVWELGCKP